MLINQLHIKGAGIRALLDYDKTIFDGMTVPEGFDKDAVINRIIYKYGDTPLYMFNPEIMKFYIEEWSNRLLPIWEKYAAAAAAEYNPIENYDRSEEKRFTHGKTVRNTGTVTDTPSGTITDSQDITATRLLSADNSQTFVNDNQEKSSGKSNERTYQDYKEERELNTSETNSGTDTEINRIHGNIGVKGAPEMQSEYFDILKRFDVIDYIADSFKAEFCLFVY